MAGGMNKMNEQGVEITCPKCGHKQIYKGKSKYWATCSMCKTSIKLVGGNEDGSENN